MVSDQEQTPEFEAWHLALSISANLPIPVPQTEFSTKDPEWIRHARAEMDMLSELRAAVRDHPEEVLDGLEIIQESIRLAFFPTKGERYQQKHPKTPEEYRAMHEEMAAADERWQRYKAQKAGPHASVAHGMGVAVRPER